VGDKEPFSFLSDKSDPDSPLDGLTSSTVKYIRYRQRKRRNPWSVPDMKKESHDVQLAPGWIAREYARTNEPGRVG
jgi:hypothetical protein